MHNRRSLRSTELVPPPPAHVVEGQLPPVAGEGIPPSHRRQRTPDTNSGKRPEAKTKIARFYRAIPNLIA